MGKLDGKKAIITGGSRGIGKAIALAFAREGADIVLSYNVEMIEAQAVIREIQKLGRRASAIKADVSLKADRDRLIEDAIIFLGEVTTFVNNAGIYLQEEYLCITEDEYDKLMATNTKSTFFLTQAICKHMIFQGVSGSIVNISSFRDTIVGKNMSHYGPGKAFTLYASKFAALEMAQHGIRINVISPGAVATRMQEKAQSDPVEWKKRIESIPLKRVGTPEDICGAAIYLASNDSSYVTGTRILVDGGRSLNPNGSLAVLRSKL